MVLFDFVILPVLLAQAIDIQKGASLFSRSCIGCHAEGGNIIQPVSIFQLSKFQITDPRISLGISFDDFILC